MYCAGLVQVPGLRLHNSLVGCVSDGEAASLGIGVAGAAAGHRQVRPGERGAPDLGEGTCGVMG